MTRTFVSSVCFDLQHRVGIFFLLLLLTIAIGCDMKVRHSGDFVGECSQLMEMSGKETKALYTCGDVSMLCVVVLITETHFIEQIKKRTVSVLHKVEESLLANSPRQAESIVGASASS